MTKPPVTLTDDEIALVAKRFSALCAAGVTAAPSGHPRRVYFKGAEWGGDPLDPVDPDEVAQVVADLITPNR